MVTQQFLVATHQFHGKFGNLVSALQASQASDGQLLASFVASRDEGAFAALVRRHGPMVLGVCRRTLNNAQDAEDAFQATFVVLARKAESLRQPELLGNWLYGVAFRASMKARALRQRRSQEKQVDPMLNDRPISESGDWHDVQAVLDEELARLPDLYRAAVVLCDLEGKSRKEAAVQLKTPEGTLSSRLNTARKMLAKRLTRRGVTLSAGALATLVAHNAASAAVPTTLMTSTLKAVGVAAAGNLAAGGAISATVVSLTEGVLQAMFLTKLKFVLTIALAVAVSLGGLGLVGVNRFVAAQPADVKKSNDAPKQDPKAAPAPTKAPETKKAEEFVELKDKLRKQQDEIDKIRTAMIKDIDEEVKKISDSIAKEKEAGKGGKDREAYGRASKLTMQKMHLSHLKYQVESGNYYGERKSGLSEEQRLGLRVVALTPAIVEQLGLEKDKGMIVDRVEKDSPAGKAGLKTHDILLKVNGKAIPGSHKEFTKILAEVQPATPFEVVVLRQGKQETVGGIAIPAK